MAIHPIDFRYGTPEMKRVWSEDNRFTCIVRVEVALAHAQGVVGMIPAEDAAIIEKNALSASRVRAKEIEAEISHDTMAISRAIAEVCGDAGRWIHYGATSNDILDTATGLQLKEAYDLLEKKLSTLMGVFLKRADETKKSDLHRKDPRSAGRADDLRPSVCNLGVRDLTASHQT